MEINFIAILSSLLINILKRFSSKLSLIIVSKLNKTEAKEMACLKNEINTLYKDRDSYNQIYDFAKYELVDRKINKLLDKIQTSKTNSRKVKMGQIMYMNIFLTIIILILSIFLIWSYRNTPMIDFSDFFNNGSSKNETIRNEIEETHIFYPLSNLFSFPCTNKPNSIGFTFWLFIANRIIDVICHKFGNQDQSITKIENHSD